jgi:cell wall assembly regulator SMI1
VSSRGHAVHLHTPETSKTPAGMSWFTALFGSKRKGKDILPTVHASHEPQYDPLGTARTVMPAHQRSTSSSSVQFPPKPSFARDSYASSSHVPPSPGLAGRELHQPPAHPSQQHLVYPTADNPSYPSLKQTFQRLERILSPVYPELWDTLSYGLPAAQWVSFQSSVHCRLPRDVHEYLALHDGQDVHSLSSNEAPHTMGLFWGLWMMTSEEIVQEWAMLRVLERRLAKGQVAVDDPFSVVNLPARVQRRMKACPAGWVRSCYSHPSWIPLIKDDQGNYIGIDLDPPPATPSTPLSAGSSAGGDWSAVAARPGQVIAFGREMDTKTVLFPGWGSTSEHDAAGGWARFLSAFADDLDSGEFGMLGDRERGTSEEPERDDSDPSDDGIGDLGYFEDARDAEDSNVSDSRGRKRASLHANGKGSKWRLRHPYKGMGVIEALCVRSKQRWQEVGVVEPNTDLGVSTASSQAPRDQPEASSSTQEADASAEILPPLPASPHLIFSPPSPERHARFDELPAQPTDTSADPSRPLSPTRTSIEAARLKSALSNKPKGKRSSMAPPVSPVMIPTMHDLLMEEAERPTDSVAVDMSN